MVLSFRGEGGRHIKVDLHCKSTGGGGRAKASEVKGTVDRYNFDQNQEGLPLRELSGLNDYQP